MAGTIAVQKKNGGNASDGRGLFNDQPFSPTDGERLADIEIRFPFVPSGGLGPRSAEAPPTLEEKPYSGPSNGVADKKKII